MASIINAVDMSNNFNLLDNSINYTSNSVTNIQKKIRMFKLEINKGVDTKSFDIMAKKIDTVADKMSTVLDSFTEIKPQSTININMGNIDAAAEKTKTLSEKYSEGVAKLSNFAEKAKGIATSVWPAVKAGMAMSDSYARQNSQLEAINDGTQSQAVLQNKVFAAAQNSRTSYAKTAETVTKLGTMDNFKTNDEAIYFTEALNKAFSGMDASSAASGIDQITQAMASGTLQGDDLMSVMEKAPALAQAVENYTGKSPADFQEETGGIPANVLKNAVYNGADSINKAFENTPETFEQLGLKLQNSILQAVGPILLLISQSAGWISDNWSTLEPIFWGIAGAVTAFTVGLGILKAKAMLMTIAQNGLNTSMIASPLFWIAIIIGVIIGVIAKWIQSVGGIKIAWMIVVNALLTAWDWVKIGFFIGVYWIMDLFSRMLLKIQTISVGIQNYLGDMKVNVLTILQGMVNGAIGIINKFIGLLNKIPGVSINTLSQVDFASTAKLENEAAKQARNGKLEEYRSQVEAGIADRAAKIEQMKEDARAATAKREGEINAAKLAAETQDKATKKYTADKYVEEKANPYNLTKNNPANQALQNNIADTAANTGSMKNSMDVSEEDLKYMRDIAEQEVINRFTTAEIKVDMTNNNNINSNLDLDGVVAHMEKKVYETLTVAAEGVYI